MYQNKKGKQLAEKAGDQGAAGQGWSELAAHTKASRIAAESGEAPPPPADDGGFGGGGFSGVDSLPKKAVSDEEAELLKMLKGFGSNTFEGAEAGGAPPRSDAAAKPKAPPKPTAGAKPKPAAKPAAKPASAPPPSSGKSQQAEEEAELLAMLKGLSSGGGGGDGGDDGGGAQAPKEDNRTLEEKLDDSNFNTRKGAYGELAKLFEAEKDGASEVFASKAETILEVVAKEKNANAFAAGLPALEAFVVKADAAAGLGPQVAEQVVRQGFKQPKPKAVEQARRVVVACVEASGPDEVLEFVYAALNDTGPKLPIEAAKVLIECVAAFGPFVLPLKPLAAKAVGLLVKPDKKVQEQGQKLLLELAKWMGAPCLMFSINKLNDKDSKAFLKKLEEFPPSSMKPPRTLRSPPPPQDYEFDESFNLVIGLVEPVDLLAELKKTEYSEKIKSEKWNGKVAAMDIVVVCCGSPPKILPGDFSGLMGSLRACAGEKMIAVVISAVNTTGVLAEGLGEEFRGYGKASAQDFISKMKDAKIVAPAIGALSKMYGSSIPGHDCFSSIQSTVFPKTDKAVPPHAMIGVLGFAAGCVAKDKIPMSKAEVDELTGLGVDVLTKVSDPKVKAAAVELMTQLSMREKKGKPDKAGPVSKALEVLAESKDSGARLLHKKILERADPDVAAGGKSPAGKEAAKKDDKSPKKESKKAAEKASPEKKAS